ncbi:pyridoxal-dependent decarboxylase [Ophiostoma piceae UAMH 11346]|uniref:Pyridoxal-dependent decarboxylase n=1 Tax=Ophiostoma piceae (strain UAMH 11346) TaxID=1262450 RepID=S3BS15_OPHP1|nr:pyridoxal-dependent decarboxylase [Ophiostoma piceae UAMH 11346]
MDDSKCLSDAYVRLRAAVSKLGEETAIAGTSDSVAATLPSATAVQKALSSLPHRGDAGYLEPRGFDATLDYLVGTVVPALNGQNLGGRYYGFVTGSTLPVAEAADNIVTALDQNLHAHLPAQTVSTSVEAAALEMLLEVVGLGEAGFGGRIFTTGATSSNVLGLTLGREGVLSMRLDGGPAESVSELGMLSACRKAGVSDIQVLTSMGHSSLYKAASIAGIGRGSVVDLPYSDAEPWRLNVDHVEETLMSSPGTAFIIVVSAGEVNTGRFATTGLADMQRLRALADKYGAWLHVDAAFGLFAMVLPDKPDFARLRQYAQGIELADSITSDAHKLLNVPYDAGIFFSRYPQLQHQVFQNANAAYLGGPSSSSSSSFPAIPSPMNMGIENSRRFRALPIYAVLLSEGRLGLSTMVSRMVRLARGVHEILAKIPGYETLGGDSIEDTYIGVLFWAKDDTVNANLASRINASREIYVSPTAWAGHSACRVAVSSWRVAQGDLQIVERVLRRAVASV